MDTISERDFRRGFYLAAAEVVRTHDQPTIAADLLRIFGPVNFDGIDGYDREVLEPIAVEPASCRGVVEG